MKASDYIVQFLYAQGVRNVFLLIGGMITHLVDSLYHHGEIQIVNVHHEQAAAFAAEGVARVTGLPGVAMATSGPGATNLITGIGSCFFDSYPAMFITGQVNVNEQKGNRKIRQLGFQETDIVSIVSPITKAAWRVNSPDELPEILEKAYIISCSGRPGPVLIDIPMDIQRGNTTVPVDKVKFEQNDFDRASIPTLLADLQSVNRPLILAGGGIRSAGVINQFREFVELVKAPVINSMMAVDALPYNHPLRIGMLGSYGNRWVNLAVARSDFLLVLGSRLDIRQTGADTVAFKADRKIYHVDCEPGELNNRVQGCFDILAHLRPFLEVVNKESLNHKFQDRNEWLDEINSLKEEWPDTAELANIPGINPNSLMHQISKVSRKAISYVVDVGNHQMWASQSLEIESHQRFITSGGMGAMGFALPTAIGVSLASSGQPVVLIAGDGGFQVNIQELQTVVRNNLPLKMVILNNHSLGMVRQFQQSYFGERYPSTYWGYSTPDFTRVAQAYGIAAYSIVEPDEIQTGLGMMWQDPKSPFLLEVSIDINANAYPKLAFGHTIADMEPFVKPLDMEGT
jgi:acetolactate synthase I/II/III large subunit